MPPVSQPIYDKDGNVVSTYTGATPITSPLEAGYDPAYGYSFTPPTTTAPSEAVTSSSGTLPQDEAKLGTDITTQSAPTYTSPASDKYLADIDAQSAALTQRQKDEEAAIQAQFDSLLRSTENQQRNEVGYTSAGLARAGGYLGVSGSGTGVLLNLAQTHRNELQSLESKRQAALSAARNAYTDKQFDLARLKATEAKAVEKEIYDRQQAYNKSVAEANKKAADETKKKNTEISIYNAISSGYTDPLDIYNQLGGDTSIEDINNFLTKSTPKDKNGQFAYTTAQTAKLLGSGLGIKDIKAAQDYINVHGYDDAFRGQLSATQKVAFDSVYREKATGKSTGLSVDYIPSKISTVVGQYGLSKIFEDLMSSDVPSWFYPVLKEIGASHYKDIGLDGPGSIDPSSDIAQNIWKQFKSTSDINLFIQEMNKKITGSSGAVSTGGSVNFGALSSSLPPPVEG